MKAAQKRQDSADGLKAERDAAAAKRGPTLHGEEKRRAEQLKNALPKRDCAVGREHTEHPAPAHALRARTYPGFISVRFIAQGVAQSRLLLLLTGVGGSSQRPHFIKKPATPPNVAPCTAAPQPTIEIHRQRF